MKTVVKIYIKFIIYRPSIVCRYSSCTVYLGIYRNGTLKVILCSSSMIKSSDAIIISYLKDLQPRIRRSEIIIIEPSRSSHVIYNNVYVIIKIYTYIVVLKLILIYQNTAWYLVFFRRFSVGI